MRQLHGKTRQWGGGGEGKEEEERKHQKQIFKHSYVFIDMLYLQSEQYDIKTSLHYNLTETPTKLGRTLSI